MNTARHYSNSDDIALQAGARRFLNQWSAGLDLKFEQGKLAFVVPSDMQAISASQGPRDLQGPRDSHASHAQSYCVQWLADYLKGVGQPFDTRFFLDQASLNSALNPPSFRMQVWQAVSNIPFGEVRSYQDIARQVGRPRAARAVGTAVGQNPCMLFRPCHRVVTTKGGIGGFAYDLRIKQALLTHEGIVI